MANLPYSLDLSSDNRASKTDEGPRPPHDDLPVKPPYEHSTISRLPSELIALIFKALAAAHRESIYPYTWGQRGWHRLGWIRVTHVCRYWREIAIQNSSLWCSIDTGLGLPFLEEQLARSKSSPISWSIHSDISPRQIALVSQHLFHIKHLSCTDLLGRPGEFAEKVLTRPAPLLERLTITESTYSGQSQLLTILPSGIFADSTPSLRCLSIRGAQLPWLLPTLSNLVELKINAVTTALYSTPSGSACSPINGRPIPASSLIYYALPQMRSLRTLHLAACLPEPTTEGHEIVDMPYLEDLRLTGEVTSCGQLINHIIIPPRCRLLLHCVLTPTGRLGDAEFIVPLLVRCAGSAKYATTMLFSDKNVSLSLHESPNDDAASMTLDQWCTPGLLGRINLAIRCEDNAPQPPDWCSYTLISKLSEGLSPVDIHSLSIVWTSPAFEPYRLWHKAFKAFHNIRHLHVCHFSMVMLAIAWSPVVRDAWGPLLDQEQLPTAEDLRAFPHLASLSLLAITPDQNFLGLTFHEALQEALIERKNSDMALQKLSLVRCKMEEDEVEHLKELVPTLRWEKYEDEQ
ncbi:hypothetical protein EVG20_g5804 [Dentipellis fragilis]|uniref:F-box domain-containing protein n=1 Tax=Dentipellis fragilis TaxID=205917 RepID=A0A4Y9YT15_9AGAM|nr:hypothetical protein EVG20_g5804 [Dentipellis fragilis]